MLFSFVSLFFSFLVLSWLVFFALLKCNLQQHLFRGFSLCRYVWCWEPIFRLWCSSFYYFFADWINFFSLNSINSIVSDFSSHSFHLNWSTPFFDSLWSYTHTRMEYTAIYQSICLLIYEQLCKWVRLLFSYIQWKKINFNFIPYSLRCLINMFISLRSQ